jgi:hypothetical protein
VQPEQFEQLERERLRALRECDLIAINRLHADDYELITSGGFAYETFEPASPVRVRAFGSAAVLRYQARIVVSDAAGATDSGLFWHTDIWEPRGEGWRAVWSQATRIQQGGAEAES